MKNSIQKRRIGVIIVLLSLCAIPFIFEYLKNNPSDSIFLTLEIMAIVIFLVSFIATLVNTGLWSFTHKSLIKLDERETALTSKSLRYAYGFFTVLVLVFLLSLSITSTPINVVMVVSLILFAHLLPAAILAWTEKSV